MTNHQFEIYPFNAFERSTKRKGFIVEGLGEIAGSNIICFEGYRLNQYADGREIIEADLFEPYLMIVPDELSGRGIGTALLTRAFKEASDRGFSRGRLEIDNPAVLTIMRRLLDGDILASARFYLAPSDPRTDEYIATNDLETAGTAVTAHEAEAHLNSILLNEFGMRGIEAEAVHCLVEF